MNIVKTSLPKNSMLNTSNVKYDYVDSFQDTINDIDNNFNSTDIGKAFFTSGPKWVGELFSLRNKIVSLVGLKTSEKINNREKQLENFKCEPGEQMGLFKVFTKTENEVILGEDDRHLNFRVSLFLEKTEGSTMKNLIVSTTVVFNNWFGRLYFIPVRPFHRLIVPSMLKGIIRELEQRNDYGDK